MDVSLDLYAFQSSIFAVSLTLLLLIVVFLYKPKSRLVNLPPGTTGFPFIGETLEFGKACKAGAPEKFTNDRITKYSSNVFRTSLLGENCVVFCGDEGNKFLLSTANDDLKPWFPHSMIKTLTGNSNFCFETAVSKWQGMQHEFLKTNALKYYIPIMDSMSKHHLISDWLPNRVVKVFPLVQKCMLAVACRLFFKIEDPDDVLEIDEPFATCIAGIISLPIDLPFTKHRAALKASKTIHKKLLSIIAERKIELASKDSSTGTDEESAAPDLLTRLLQTLDENGNRVLIDEEISTSLLGMLFASHHALTSAITFVLKQLGEDPQVYHKVFKEQMEIANAKGPGELLNWSDIQNMRYSWSVVCESMRLTPPGQGTFREVVKDVTYQGFTIPKGWKAYWTVYSTNKNPNYFKEPHKFDPSRFEGGESSPLPYTFTTFGMGPHSCPGKEYARVGILIFIHNVVTKFKWHNLMPDEKNTCVGSVVPNNGLPIQIQAHSHL